MNARVRRAAARARTSRTGARIAASLILPVDWELAPDLPPPGVVDCWIGVVQEGDRRIVQLAGRLEMAQVPELLRACGAPRTLQLDLTDLVSADTAGVEALQQARARGALLVGVPGYIQLKLDSPV